MVKGTSRSITEPHKTGRCQRGNKRRKIGRTSDVRRRESRTPGGTGVTPDRNLHRQGVRRAQERVREVLDLTDRDEKFREETVEILHAEIVEILHAEIAETIEGEIEVGPRAQTLGTDARAMTDLGTTKENEALAVTRERGAQAALKDGGRITPPDPGRRLEPLGTTRVRNGQSPRSLNQLTNQKIYEITCQRVMSTPRARPMSRPAIATLPKHRSPTWFHRGWRWLGMEVSGHPIST